MKNRSDHGRKHAAGHWRSESQLQVLYRSSNESGLDSSVIKTFDAYNIHTETANEALMRQNTQDFEHFEETYSDTIAKNKKSDCISEYRGQWGEREIHKDLLQDTPSPRAMRCLGEFRNMQVPITQSVLYCSYSSADAPASINSTLTSTTTSLPVLFSMPQYNQSHLFVIFIREGRRGVPIYSDVLGMGNNEDCEVLLCDPVRKPTIVMTATRTRRSGEKDEFAGDPLAIAIFEICTSNKWSIKARATTLHVCEF